MQGGAGVVLVVWCVHVIRVAIAEDQDGTVDVLARYCIYQLLSTQSLGQVHTTTHTCVLSLWIHMVCNYLNFNSINILTISV